MSKPLARPSGLFWFALLGTVLSAHFACGRAERAAEPTDGEPAAVDGCSSSNCDAVTLATSEPSEHLPPAPQRRCGDDGVVSGAVALNVQADVDALEGCERVAGDLTLTAFEGADLAALLSLRTIDGRLQVRGGAGEDADATAVGAFANVQQVGALLLFNLELPDLSGLSGLRRILGLGHRAEDSALPDGADADLEISSSSELTDLHGLDSLEQARTITLSDNPDLASTLGLRAGAVNTLLARGCPLVDLEGLSSVQQLSIYGSALTGLSNLGAVSQLKRLYLVSNDQLVNLRGGQFPTEMETILVSSNATLTDLRGLEDLEHLEYLELTQNPLLESLSGLDGLQSAGSLFVVRNPALTRMDGLGALREAEDLAFYDSIALKRIGAFAAGSQIGGLVISNSPELRSLAGLGDATFGSLGFSSISAPNLAGLEQVTVTGAFSLADDAQLISLAGLPQLSPGISLRLADTPALEDGQALAALRSLRDLTLENAGLENLDALQTLQQLGGLSLQWNQRLTQIEAVRGVAGLNGMVVSHNPALASLPTFTGATSECEGCGPFGLQVVDNGVLESGPGLPLIERAASFEISANPLLASIPEFTALRSADTVFIESNPLLTALGLPRLGQSSAIWIRDNFSLDDAPLAPLKNIPGASVKIVSNLNGPSRLDPCPWRQDGWCDEPSEDCAAGTDIEDCALGAPPTPGDAGPLR